MPGAGQRVCPAPARFVWPALLMPVLLVLAAGELAGPAWRIGVPVAVICALGIPHGALDGEIARDVLRVRFGPVWFAVFAVPYIALFAGVIVAWRVAPHLTLAGFLAGSVWHFGVEDAGPAPLGAAARGGLAVALPVLLHPAATAQFLGLVSLMPMVHLPAWLVGAAWLWCLIAIAWVANAVRRQDWSGLADATLAAMLFVILPPLPAFAAYFVCLHAPRHMRALVTGGQLHRVRTMREAGLRALPLTVLTVVIGAALWPLFPGAPATRSLALTIQVLSALTLPHMLLPPALQAYAAGGRRTAPKLHAG